MAQGSIVQISTLKKIDYLKDPRVFCVQFHDRALDVCNAALLQFFNAFFHLATWRTAKNNKYNTLSMLWLSSANLEKPKRIPNAFGGRHKEKELNGSTRHIYEREQEKTKYIR